MCRGNPHQGIPSTTVTASHVTQGRVEYESTISHGMDEGMDLWEALKMEVAGLSETSATIYQTMWNHIQKI
jgi:hypothetical protein